MGAQGDRPNVVETPIIGGLSTSYGTVSQEDSPPQTSQEPETSPALPVSPSALEAQPILWQDRSGASKIRYFLFQVLRGILFCIFAAICFEILLVVSKPPVLKSCRSSLLLPRRTGTTSGGKKKEKKRSPITNL
jgi:hypothetical protein